MPTRTGTTSTDVALSLRTTYTTPLLAQVASGNTIQAAHYTMLKNFINAVGPHTHTLTDFSTIGDLVGGNTGANNSTVDTVSAVSGFTAITTTFSAGGTITAAHFNGMRNQVEVLRSHNHAWDDQTA